MPRASRWLCPLLIAATGAAMAAWTWGTWPDVLIDYGRELYIAWRLAEGEALYRDVAHFNGPLSQVANGALFQLFGAGLCTLVAANGAVLAAATALLYRLLARASGRWAATAACVTFLTVFAFSQYVPVGNYNWACPYSHEMTHGLALCLGALACLGAYLRRARARWCVGAGLCLGLAFLTKAEVFAAGLGATAGGGALAWWVRRPGRRRMRRHGAALAAGLAAPPLVAFLALWAAMPAGQALEGTLGSWPHALNPELAANRYYRRGMGTLEPGRNLARMGLWAVRYAAVVLPAALLALGMRQRRRRARLWAAAGLFALVAGVLGANSLRLRWQMAWLEALRPLPLVMLGLGLWAGASALRARAEPQRAPRAVLQVALVAFAFLLMLKMLLHVRVYHYGFALAMPATLMAVVALVGWAPAAVARRGGSPAVFLGAALALWAVALAAHVGIAWRLVGRKTEWVGEGADAFRAGPRAPRLNAALALVAEHVGREETLAVLPEGAMVNYLARRPNPTPYVKFAPPEWIMFGRDRWLAAFQTSPPDAVLLVHKDSSEYGFRFFGRDYARDLGAWLAARYRGVARAGAVPLRGREFGLLVLRRRAQAGEGGRE
ncbi:MAG: hypothetical protein ACLF0G_09060 [Candidatus Brocadiia bacterium]